MDQCCDLSHPTWCLSLEERQRGDTPTPQLHTGHLAQLPSKQQGITPLHTTLPASPLPVGFLLLSSSFDAGSSSQPSFLGPT